LERLSLPEIKSGRIDGANVRDVGQTVDATTLSWCRRTGISASSRALDRNSLVSAHASNWENRLSGTSIARFAAVR